MLLRIRISFSFIVLVTLHSICFSQSDTIVVQRVTTDFDVNGNGSNVNWEGVPWIDIASTTPDENRNTRAKTLYSNTGIYFLFECEDALITSTLTEDYADLYNEDVVEVFLWTDEKYPFYFEYELSPQNYELPIFVPNVKGDFFGWLPWHYEGERKIRHATYLDKKGGKVKSWRAEFFIPFALLKPMTHVPPLSGTTWRVNMYRLDYDKGQTRWEWQPITTNFHDYERFGTFVFE